jgi:hypothetical protein
MFYINIKIKCNNHIVLAVDLIAAALYNGKEIFLHGLFFWVN